MLITRINIVPRDSYKGINVWLLNVALPALALRYVPEIEWGFGTIIPAISPIIVWIGANLFIGIYAKKARIDRATKTALIVSCGLGNTAFLGFPMISAFFGEENIQYAIVFDQMTFILFSTMAVSLVLKTLSGGKISPFFIVKKIFLFPTFLATITALIVSPFLDYSIINPFLEKILATLSPLALFSIGMQMKFGNWHSELRNIIVSLSYKLLLAPLIIFAIVKFSGLDGMTGNITVFEAAMPAHISASLLASQYELNPQLCNLIVGVGIIVSFVSSAIWWWVM
jgi:predicted permease